MNEKPCIETHAPKLLSLTFLARDGVPPPLFVEMSFTWTFPRNQDAKVKLKSELISIKF